MTDRRINFYAVFASVLTAVFSLSLFPILIGQIKETLSLPIGIVSVFFSYLLLGGLLSLGLSTIALFCGRQFMRWTIVAAVSIAAIAWIKGGFMQWDYGPMDGNPIDWSRYPLAGKLDVALIVAVVAVAFWQRRAVVRHAMTVCAFLCLAQVLFTGWISPAFTKASFADLFAKETILTNAKDAEILSTSNNLILIVLDTFPSDIFGEIIEKQENVKNDFSGFTFFSDATSAYPYTALSIPSVLTGQYYLNRTPYPHYLYESYRNPLSILPKLKRAGYYVELDKWGAASPIPPLIDLSSNSERYFTPQLQTLGTLQLLALYYAAPQFIKQLWHEITIETFMSLMGLQDNNLDFIKEGMTLPVQKTEQPVAKFIHLKGPHVPLYRYAGHGFDYFAAAQNKNAVVEKATPSRENFTSVAEQSIKAVSAYLEKLKQAGVYDRSTIVLFGDHGAGLQGQDFVPPNRQISAAENVTLPIQAAAFPLLLVKPAHKTGPLETSSQAVSLTDLNCSVHGLLDNKIADGCQSLFKPADPAVRKERLHFSVRAAVDKDGFYSVMRQFKVGSPAWSSDAWNDSGELFFRERAVKAPLYDFGNLIEFGADGSSQSYEAFGWNDPSKGFTWTIGQESTLTIPLRYAPPGPIVLEAILSPFVHAGKLDRQRVQVYADGERIAEWTASGSGRYRAVIPQRLALDRSVKIRFRLPDAISPLRLGIGDDASVLGVQMQTIILRELTDRRNVLSFGRGGTSEPYQIGGWGDPGDGFTWTIGPQAALALPLREVPKRAGILDVSLIPFLVRGKRERQRIKVFANEEVIAEWIAAEAGSYRAIVPRHLASDRVLNIRFDLPDAISPFDLGAGSDQAVLGIQIQSLVLSELPDLRDGTLSFGVNGNARPSQLGGWGEPGEGFTWTVGKQPSLALQVPPASGPLMLKALLSPLIVPGKVDRQTVRVYANDKKIDEWIAIQTREYRAVIPQRVAKEGLVVIRFDLPDAASAADLGIAESRAVLGLQVQSVGVSDFDYRIGDVIAFGKTGNAAKYQIDGWDAPNDGFTWTFGKRASLAVPVSQSSGMLVLQTSFVPLTVPGKLDRQRVDVYANEERIANWAATAGGEFRVVVPARLLDKGFIDLRFELPDASSLAQLGLGAGREELGLQMRSLILRQVDYSIGELVKFGREGNAAPYQIEGWNDPSEGFTWTVGTTSRIALPANVPPSKNLQLEASIVPFVVPGKLSAQRVEVIVNGRKITEWSVRESGLFIASIPGEILTGGIIDVRFDLPDATSQAALGLNNDTTVFALQLISLMLREVP